MMVIYEVSYDDVLLGHLYIKDRQHHYVPIPEAAEDLRHKVPLIREMIHGYPWGKPIPFFQERIENATRFGKERLIRYHTDLFAMRMISD